MMKNVIAIVSAATKKKNHWTILLILPGERMLYSFLYLYWPSMSKSHIVEKISN